MTLGLRREGDPFGTTQRAAHYRTIGPKATVFDVGEINVKFCSRAGQKIELRMFRLSSGVGIARAGVVKSQ